MQCVFCEVCLAEIGVHLNTYVMLPVKKRRWMRISAPGTQPFSGNSLFHLLPFPPSFFLLIEGKKASFRGGGNEYHPRVVHVHIKHNKYYAIRSGAWAFIFSPFHSIQLIHSSMVTILFIVAVVLNAST